MADAKHTPGPWAVEPVSFNGHRQAGAYSVVSRTGSSAGEPLCVHLFPRKDVVDDDRLPDARLVAAAPDLLAACEAAAELMRLTRDALRQVFGAGRRNETLEGPLAQVEAAITKARES